jgi:DNA-binding GntR family transcriptional regulator
VGAPLLLLEQIDYGANGMVVLYSDEYLPAYLTVQVWRKGPG